MATVIRITPEEDELSQDPKKNICCPVDGCGKVFNCGSNLQLHKIKTHHLIKSSTDQAIWSGKGEGKGETYIYHCPVKRCKYFQDKERHFKSYTSLKQHYLIQHGESKFKCSKCTSSFGMEKSLRAHEKRCGTIYKCSTCNCPYTTLESLKRHCALKNHDIPQELNDRYRQLEKEKELKTSKEKKIPSNEPVAENPESQINIFVFNIEPGPLANNKMIKKPVRRILPKPEQSVPTNSVYDKQQPTTSTEFDHRSVETQMEDVPTVGASTQTSGDYILRNAMMCANIPVRSSSFKVRKESRSSQVSPRAKIRAGKRVSTATQSTDCNIPKQRRKRKHSAAAGTSSVHNEIPGNVPFKGIQTYPITHFNYEDYSDIDTQTISLFEELEATLAESISTQTRESFLNKPPIQCTHTIETQTNTSLNDGYISADDSLRRMDTPTIISSSLMMSTGTDPSFSEPIPDSSGIDSDFCDTCLVDVGTSALMLNNTQTQTIDSMCEQILSHMETQTSDDLDFSDLLLTDNETQTVYEIDDISSSVEIQTNLHATHHTQANVKADMQTQTGFRELDTMFETSCQTDFDVLFENLQNI